jgi:1,2-diacylglycerol 3-beta-glucosyltransferase
VLISVLCAIVLAPVALVLWLPLASEAGALLLSMRRRDRWKEKMQSEQKPGLLFLVPAHNESLMIARCVHSLGAMRRERSIPTVVVIADNCSDDTALQARAAGAQVLERQNETERGKPFALAWAMSIEDLSSYDAVVIIDADTVVDAGFSDALADFHDIRDIAIQAYNGLANEGESWLSLLAGLLVRVRYDGQYPLKERAGLNCPLTGNGMCLGVSLLKRCGFAEGTALTENWEIYARYTAAGETIRFSRGSFVGAREAPSLDQGATQRKRWQSGRLFVLRSRAREVMESRRISWHQKLDVIAELSVPGPVVHGATAILVGAILWLVGGWPSRLIALLTFASVLPLLIWGSIQFLRAPERLRLAFAMARLPLYAVWRMGIAVSAFFAGNRLGWQRSPREGAKAAL